MLLDAMINFKTKFRSSVPMSRCHTDVFSFLWSQLYFLIIILGQSEISHREASQYPESKRENAYRVATSLKQRESSF